MTVAAVNVTEIKQISPMSDVLILSSILLIIK